MAIDGTTHFISDLAGITQGFRYTNEWLTMLTNNAFIPTFYAGNAFGSFNFWMRLLSRSLFGLGLAWFGFPYLEKAAVNVTNDLNANYQITGDEII